jgi:hypothetical protein
MDSGRLTYDGFIHTEKEIHENGWIDLPSAFGLRSEKSLYCTSIGGCTVAYR